MPLRFLLVPLLMSLICCSAVNGQHHYNFARVDIENGLSHNKVFSIYRDSTGFVWFGTASGLSRFDGHTCKVFANIPTDSTSLEDNYVLDIFPFPGKKLWISGKTEASVYDPLTEKFDRSYKSYLKALGLPQSRLIYSLVDKDANYWFLFENEGLYKYSSITRKTARLFLSQTQLKKGPVTAISEDANGNLWLVFSTGYLMQVETKQLKPIKELALLEDIFRGRQFNFRVFADKQNKVWTYINGEPKGVYKIDPETRSLIRFHTGDPIRKLTDNMVKGIMQDKKGDMWIGTDHGGINILGGVDHSNIAYLVNEENDKKSLGYNSIERIYQDDEGLMWVGTAKKGVSYLNQNIVQFELYQHQRDNKNSLPYNDIIYFVEDRKGNIWIGTDGGGLIYFNRINHQFTQYVNNPSDPNSLSNNVVVSLCIDHEDKLWIGTYWGGLDVFDGKNFTHYRHDPSDPSSIADDRIWHIMEDHNNVMWIGTLQGGLNRFDRQTKKFTRYYIENNIPKPIHSNYIPVIKEDSDSNLWIGTADGLEVLNKDRTLFTYYKHTNASNSLSHQDVQDIVIDKREFVWIATRDGLNKWNKATGTFKRFTTDDGLPDNNILTIVEDKKGNLWITTPKGLCQLIINANKDDVSFEVRNFTEGNNIQGKVFNESAGLSTSDGLLLFGGSMGFNIIDPEKVIPSKRKPILAFTNIDIFNNETNVGGEAVNKNLILRKALPFANEIVLNYNENIFSIEFAALDFSGNNQYAYKLEGFNKNWMYTNSGNRRVTYTNLDPGTYTFKVKATNSDGVWGVEEKKIKIIIKPPFWKTSWAFLLYGLIIATILYLSRRYTLEKVRMRFEVNQQRKERERIQAIDAVKTKFFTNVSHEFRTPLSLIIAPLDKLIKNSGDPEQKKQVQIVQRNAKRLLNLVNQLLDFRKMEVQDFKLQPTEGDIIKFIKEITCSFSDISEMKNIALSFISNVDHLRVYFDKDKMEKILFNLLSNAFKYTPAKGYVKVQVVYVANEREEEEKISIVVEDSGIGIPEDKQEKIFERFFQNDVPANIANPGTGIGLAITKEFVKLHNGAITVNSEPDKGTSFVVLLPVHKLSDHFIPTEEIQELITPLKQENGTAKASQQKQATKNLPVILLVEDNDDFRFYLKDNLKQEYDVVETMNGQEAWEKLESLKPDLIVSDVMMAYMDGIELTKRVKRSASLASVPIILLTAVGDEEIQLESYKLGVSDYMTKPFTYELLASRIKNILAQGTQPNKKIHKAIEIQPSEIEILPVDEQFLKHVLEVIEKNISNPDFTVEELSKELFMHRAGMYRKLLSLTGLSPLEFIRNIRLKRGKQLLEKSQLTIAEIAYEVGFNNPKKFSQHFKDLFGLTPSQFQKQSAQGINLKSL